MIGEVKLDTIELMIGSHVGCMRRVQNIKKGEVLTENFGLDSNASWNTDIDGAQSELALAKFTNTYWGGAFFYKDKTRADVCDWQVRSTRHQNGCLIVRKKDIPKIKPDAIMVLVTVDTQTFRIAGSMVFAETMKPEYWRDDKPGREGKGGGAWWVEQKHLGDTL